MNIPFCLMREHTGCASEQIDLPDSINTVSDLGPSGWPV